MQLLHSAYTQHWQQKDQAVIERSRAGFTFSFSSVSLTALVVLATGTTARESFESAIVMDLGGETVSTWVNPVCMTVHSLSSRRN